MMRLARSAAWWIAATFVASAASAQAPTAPPAPETAAVLEENRQTAMGGGFGTIMGRNSFQRPHDEAVHLLGNVMDIHLAHVTTS